MILAKRRSDKIPRKKIEAKMSQSKYDDLLQTLNYLKNKEQVELIQEVKDLSSGGDYSENAGYQSAKSKLRQTNSRIDRIQDILARAEIISLDHSSERVSIGQSLELENEGKLKTYQILGSLESDPKRGLISDLSPLGSSLLNKKIGDTVEVRGKKYKIKNIY